MKNFFSVLKGKMTPREGETKMAEEGEEGKTTRSKLKVNMRRADLPATELL